MKRSLKLLLIFVMVLAIGLSACGSKESGSLGDLTQHPAPSEDTGSDPGDEADSGAYRVQDEFGLVFVYIDDGAAEVVLDSDLWKEMFNIVENLGPDSAYAADFIYDGPFPVEVTSGRVKDAIVGYVEGLDLYGPDYLATPTVALLMEDGTVEYFLANPFIGDGEGIFHSNGKLPWFSDIVSLSYAEGTDGYGAMTIYAENSVGLKFNIQYVTGLTDIFKYSWDCRIQDGQGNEHYGIIFFTEDYEVEFSSGIKFEDDEYTEITEMYTGTYNVFLNPYGDIEFTEMDFDLNLDWWIAELGDGADEADLAYWEERQNLVGTYGFRYIADSGVLYFWLNHGDALMETGWRGDPIEEYYFTQAFY